jgi:cyclic beta-1,2-glucan synthetase
VDGPAVGPVQHETDRARFLGRGRMPARPAALDPGAELSGTTGAVLDPVFSLRQRVRLAPGVSASIAFTTAVVFSREAALVLADQYHDVHGVQRAFELAWAHTQVQLRHLHLSAEEAHLYQRLAAHLIYTGPVLRASAALLASNRQGREGLWRHGISGDRPILLVRVVEADDVALVRKVVLAHAWWHLQGFEVDLVVLNEHASGYQEEVQQQLQALVRSSDSHDRIDKPGGVFLRQSDHLAGEDRVLLLTAARVVLSGSRGSLAAQLEQQEKRPPLPERLAGRRTGGGGGPPSASWGREGSPDGGTPTLRFANGRGGFSTDGQEYVIAAAPGSLPPAPWTNVIANPRFGFLATESGGGYTWAGNSQQNRLTPWSNDPVTDPPGEVVYLRDEATGEVWTPTPRPLGHPGCLVRHGAGYTIFEQTACGLQSELLLFVPAEDAVKVLRLRVRNTGRHARTLSATFYAEWVLGTLRDQAPMQVVTERDTDTGALLARNPFTTDFADGIAFAYASPGPFTFTADRTEFLGRNGAVDRPAALERVGLSGQVGASLDPCAALMVPLTLPAGGEREVVFLLGQGQGTEEARVLARRYADPATVQSAFDEVRRRWEGVLGTVQVRTPDAGMDLLLNRWLLYQVLSCRLWGRSAFYQSGGAYGFRDQLQDSMALVYAAPEEARAHLLRAASRQFLEGDVQHWWHPPAGRGVRTRFSDDFLWLPFVALHYVTTTGDRTVLDEPASFLRAPTLQADQDEVYGLPEVTEEKAPLYEHCARALDHGLRFGAHGLPLMGIGDWNDGMNRVGAGGKGESVWNAWFLLSMLPRFADIAEQRGNTERAARWREAAASLKTAVEEAWDGGWYRRAYFDDGTPLGSASNDECRIDSLPQSWAVISGAGEQTRAREAMAAVERLLVKPDQGRLQAGYIKGYVPGIRENGGQYTHAATWVVQATALLGQGTRAGQLFDLLSPISHTASAETLARYKVEPYVVAADVYGVPPHVGRGGWTWYTGSAAWLYRVGLESILGFHLEGDRLRLDPCIPAAWPSFEITYRHRSATYRIVVENSAQVERGVKSVRVDGTEQADGVVPLADEGTHEVRVVLGLEKGTRIIFG